MIIPPKAIYRFSETSIKLPVASFMEWEIMILKFVMEKQKILNNQNKLVKEQS